MSCLVVSTSLVILVSTWKFQYDCLYLLQINSGSVRYTSRRLDSDGRTAVAIALPSESGDLHTVPSVRLQARYVQLESFVVHHVEAHRVIEETLALLS